MKKLDKIILFSVFFLLVAIIVLMVVMLVQKGRIYLGRNIVYENVVEEKKLISENIVFLGDSITEFYDLDKYYDDYYHVQSGHSGDKTYQILDNMYERVYRYNPSKVFIMLGINNLVYDGASAEEVTNDIKEICEKIKDRNKYTEIYIESISPYSNVWKNEHDNNARSAEEVNPKVVEANKILKKYAKDNNYTYIDIYDELANEEGIFDSKYTDDGLHPNDEGYKHITEKLTKYMK
ncbi:MAG: hypothetical protein IKZ96_00900 [Bacilli bacterium]|nr:hypothetical protein [Bacilli bacterium]